MANKSRHEEAAATEKDALQRAYERSLNTNKVVHIVQCTNGFELNTHGVIMKGQKPFAQFQKGNRLTSETSSVAVIVANLQSEAEPLYKKIQRIEIQSNEDMTKAAELLKRLKITDTEARAKEKEILDSSKRTIALVSGLFKPFHNLVEETDTAVKLKMSAFIANQADKAEELKSKFDDGKISMKAFVKKSNELEPAAEGVQIRSKEELIIVDVKKIPSKYMVPDSRLILQDLKAGKKVPGTKLVKTHSLAI